MEIILLILFMLFSTFGSSVLSIPFFGFQLTIFRITLILLLLILLINKKGNIKIIKKDLKFDFLPYFLLYSLITLIWVKDVMLWVKYEIYILIAFLILIIVDNFVNDKKTIGKLLFVFNISILFQSILGVYEFFSGKYLFLDDSLVELYKIQKLPVGMMGNANNFGILMCTGIIISYYLICNEKNMFLKFIYILNFIFQVIVIFICKSRASIITLIFILIVYIMFYQKNKLLKSCFFIVGIVILLNFPVFFQFLIDTESDNVRFNLLQNGIYFMFKFYGFGVGSGQISYWLEHHYIISTSNTTELHNWFFEILSNFGIIMFLIYIVSYFSITRSLYSLLRKDSNRENKIFSQTFMLLMFSFLIFGISVSNMIAIEWYWILWAIIIKFLNICKNEEIKTNNENILFS